MAEAFKIGWIQDEETFLDMLEDRNKTSHIYDRETSEVIFESEMFMRKWHKLPFEDKIRMLIDLQKLAYSWGGRKDVIVWSRGT